MQAITQDITLDSTQVQQDTTASTAQDVVTEFSEGVSETGRLVVEGEWSLLWKYISEGSLKLFSEFVPDFISALFVFILFYFSYRLLKSLLDKFLTRARRVDKGLHSLIIKTFKVISLTMIVIMVLAQFGINITALLAGLSIAGIAIGFAAKDTLENFISGVTILLDRPFRIGDYIEINGTYGQVTEITLRSTRLRTKKNEIMVMPNLQMVNQMLINHSTTGALRIDIPFGIAYDEYPDEVRNIVLNLTKGDDRLHEHRLPQVVVTNLNNSSIDMALRVFLKQASEGVQIACEYTEKSGKCSEKKILKFPIPICKSTSTRPKGWKASENRLIKSLRLRE